MDETWEETKRADRAERNLDAALRERDVARAQLAVQVGDLERLRTAYEDKNREYTTAIVALEAAGARAEEAEAERDEAQADLRRASEFAHFGGTGEPKTALGEDALNEIARLHVRANEAKAEAERLRADLRAKACWRDCLCEPRKMEAFGAEQYERGRQDGWDAHKAYSSRPKGDEVAPVTPSSTENTTLPDLLEQAAARLRSDPELTLDLRAYDGSEKVNFIPIDDRVVLTIAPRLQVSMDVKLAMLLTVQLGFAAYTAAMNQAKEERRPGAQTSPLHLCIHSENGHNMKTACGAQLDPWTDPPNWVFDDASTTCDACKQKAATK